MILRFGGEGDETGFTTGMERKSPNGINCQRSHRSIPDLNYFSHQEDGRKIEEKKYTTHDTWNMIKNKKD
jgi:hypothetical protein